LNEECDQGLEREDRHLSTADEEYTSDLSNLLPLAISQNANRGRLFREGWNVTIVRPI